MSLSVLIPAHNEEAWLGRCLEALLDQDGDVSNVQIIVAVNGSSDRTASIAHSFQERSSDRGWHLVVLDLSERGKAAALNAADVAASFGTRIYLDADVVVAPSMLRELSEALSNPEPRYATGKIVLNHGQSHITRAYGRVWQRLPFVQRGTVGAGLFALNAPGRARWTEWPSIISDDTFARLNFAPHERIEVEASYRWSLVEGFRNLVRVRRRQDNGVAEVYRLFPHLMKNVDTPSPSFSELLRITLQAPFGMLVYLSVRALARLTPSNMEWTRGR
jgi:glycosyltransferase involved in cell wall biosynthesis